MLPVLKSCNFFMWSYSKQFEESENACDVIRWLKDFIPNLFKGERQAGLWNNRMNENNFELFF